MKNQYFKIYNKEKECINMEKRKFESEQEYVIKRVKEETQKEIILKVL